jgi:hypothetical protein
VARALELAESYRASPDDFTFCRILHSLASAIPQQACATAFRHLSSTSAVERPRNVLRAGETVWGRGPARLELGGGWSGGEVVNAAVNLNGQSQSKLTASRMAPAFARCSRSSAAALS